MDIKEGKLRKKLPNTTEVINNRDDEITGDVSEKTWPKFRENCTYQGVCNICKKG